MVSSSSLASLMREAPQYKVLIIHDRHTGMSLGHSIIYCIVLSCHGLYLVGEGSESIHRLLSEGSTRSSV